MSKLAVITGGTKGIGKAIAWRFARENFDLALCARTRSDLESASKEISSAFGVKVHTMVADLSQPAQAKRFTDEVMALNRSVDVLVNNAGFFTPGEVLTEPEGALAKLVEANVYSAYHTTRGLAPSMAAAKSGHIFSVCSIASIKAYPNGGSYAISKFALLGLTKVLREELKPKGVRVTAVIPGATLTDSWAGSGLPESRFMKPEDVAEAIYSAYSLSSHTVVEEIVLRPQLGDI
ncbi:MAG: SDR family NAD(P)-dependent oxidoreductase [Cyclobacteriaceae bacterium]|nr:short-chain dehydrogenase [Cytophagales bacterium]HNP76809.1 SDR family NAD(P)-dependent oxidoreductase [Cyclobacteriaceae bacterium]